MLTKNSNEIPGSDVHSLKVLSLAPTGKAAFNINGTTIHSAFQLPITQAKSSFVPLNDDKANTLYALYHDIICIIIDEISMLGSTLFHQINERLQQILFRNSEIFGGKSVILFGDFNQLPPVGDRWIFSQNIRNNYAEIVGNYIWEKFSHFELTQIMRQREDLVFATALNNLATGNLSEFEIKIFKSRECELNQVPNTTIHIMYTNAEVDNFNYQKINNLPGNLFINYANDKLMNKSILSKNTSILEKVQEFPISKTYGLPYKLFLKKEAKYMLTNNIKTSDGLTNGAIGVLKFIDFEGETITRLLFEFEDKSIGKNTRLENNMDNSTLTPINICTRIFQYKKKVI